MVFIIPLDKNVHVALHWFLSVFKCPEATPLIYILFCVSEKSIPVSLLWNKNRQRYLIFGSLSCSFLRPLPCYISTEYSSFNSKWGFSKVASWKKCWISPSRNENIKNYWAGDSKSYSHCFIFSEWKLMIQISFTTGAKSGRHDI